MSRERIQPRRIKATYFLSEGTTCVIAAVKKPIGSAWGDSFVWEPPRNPQALTWTTPPSPQSPNHHRGAQMLKGSPKKTSLFWPVFRAKLPQAWIKRSSLSMISQFLLPLEISHWITSAHIQPQATAWVTQFFNNCLQGNRVRKAQLPRALGKWVSKESCISN